MHTDQFIAPEGFLTMQKGDVHHRLRTDTTRGRVLFAVFMKERRARIVVVDHQQLTAALGRDVIPAPEPERLPPWLRSLGSIDDVHMLIDEAAQTEGPQGTPSNAARVVDARLCYIQPALDDLRAILSADDPNVVLNSHARRCDPPQNESRFRAWVYVYVAFGYSRAVLFPSYHSRGRWNRLDPAHTKPQGRPGHSGGRSRFNMTPELVERITDSFIKHARLGQTRDKVYASAMRLEFGCRTQRVSGRTVFMHPEGKPFPTQNQFWYRCELKFGRDGIKKALRGEETYRNRDAPSIGSYAMGVGNVLERVHVDVSYSKAYPKSYVGDGVRPKLAVCRIVDSLTGVCVGIGSGNGPEDGRMYQEAMFCAAIPKRLFGKLIGYEIDDNEWPGNGLPTWVVSDRGPGGSAQVLQRIQELGIARTLTPTRSPQSNSVVESRHPRSAEIAGIPAYETSDLTSIEMFKQEVELAMLANRSSSAIDRASNAQIVRGEVTPLAIYKDMLGRLRTDARPIQVEDAVRMFLPEVQLVLRDGKLHLHNRPFGGPAFQKAMTQVEQRRLEGQTLKGYCLTISTRHAWVDLGSRLVMVDALTRYRDGDEDLYLTLDDLREVGIRAAQAETSRRASRGAEIAMSRERFEERTGASFDAATRRRGAKSPTKPAVKRELAALKK